MGLQIIFTAEIEDADVVLKRLAERHIHRDRLGVDELTTFWECFEWAMRRTLGAAWVTIEDCEFIYRPYCQRSYVLTTQPCFG